VSGNYFQLGFRKKEKMDWAKTIADEAQTSAIISSDALAPKTGIPIHYARAVLKRQQSRGLVEHVTRKLYINKLSAGFNPGDLAAAISPQSYVSLESALNEWGVSNQSPSALTCVSTRQIRPIETTLAKITFGTIKKELFWGFVERKTRYGKYNLAEPEKAILDWIHFRRKKRQPLDVDEFNMQRVSRARLIKYADAYPKALRQSIYPFLLNH
jgi:predicted transcriptional regulator of viral defense system